MINLINYISLERNIRYGILLPLTNVPCIGNFNQITLNKFPSCLVTAGLDFGYD